MEEVRLYIPLYWKYQHPVTLTVFQLYRGIEWFYRV
jgi:hypothetical protein